MRGAGDGLPRVPDRHGRFTPGTGAGHAEPPLPHQARRVRWRPARRRGRRVPRAARRDGGRRSRPTGSWSSPRPVRGARRGVAANGAAAQGLAHGGRGGGGPGGGPHRRAASSRARRRSCRQLLGLFENGLAGFLFGGRTRPFTRLDGPEQDRVLVEWRDSRLAVRRTGYAALRTLVLAGYYQSPHRLAGRGLPRAAGHLQGCPVAAGVAGRRRAPPGRQRGVGRGGRCHDRRRANPHRRATTPVDTTLHADVVVVGSGAGGSVVAERLTARGLEWCCWRRAATGPAAASTGGRTTPIRTSTRRWATGRRTTSRCSSSRAGAWAAAPR